MGTCDGIVSTVHKYASRRFLWTRGLRREFAAPRLLGLRVRIRPGGGHGYLFLLSVVCCQVEVFASGLITRPEESYRVWMCVCMCVNVIMNPRKGGALGPLEAVLSRKVNLCESAMKYVT